MDCGYTTAEDGQAQVHRLRHHYTFNIDSYVLYDQFIIAIDLVLSYL